MYALGVTDQPHNPSDYPPFGVTVDLVVFSIINKSLRILLIQRDQTPFLGKWALPGGFVLPHENLEQAARRELAEETNIGKEVGHLEQLGTYGHPDRDPRQRVVTVAYWGIAHDLPEPQGGSDARYAEHVPVAEVASGNIRLAFDHNKILTDAIRRIHHKISYTPLATRFCAKEFTISELRSAYDAIWQDTIEFTNLENIKPIPATFEQPKLSLVTPDLKMKYQIASAPPKVANPPALTLAKPIKGSDYTKLDTGNFQRSVLQIEGFLQSTGKKSSPSASGGRPAELYTAGDIKELTPPIHPKTPKPKK